MGKFRFFVLYSYCMFNFLRLAKFFDGEGNAGGSAVLFRETLHTTTHFSRILRRSMVAIMFVKIHLRGRLLKIDNVHLEPGLQPQEVACVVAWVGLRRRHQADLFCACTRVTSGSRAFLCFPTQTHPEWLLSGEEHAAVAAAHSSTAGRHHRRKKNSEPHSHLSTSIVHDAQTDEIRETVGVNSHQDRGSNIIIIPFQECDTVGPE